MNEQLHIDPNAPSFADIYGRPEEQTAIVDGPSPHETVGEPTLGDPRLEIVQASGVAVLSATVEAPRLDQINPDERNTGLGGLALAA